MILTALALARREMLKFWREKARVVGFAAAPLLFWFVVSAGFNDFARFFAGSIALTLMFSAVFSNMSVIDDRKEGFLAGVLVTPAPRAGVVLGKVLGATILAWLQSLVFLFFLPLTGLTPGFFGILGAAGVLLLIGLLFTLLGFLCAWRMPSTQAFHGVINMLLLPMWMLSGSLFRVGEAHPLMQRLMQVNPMTYGISLLDVCLGGTSPFSMALSLAVLCGTTALLFGAALWFIGRSEYATA
ncbi:ABC transporter permease [Bryobacter aggregatus]|uniref:ABC transporter permease n=1 Tax=Bryobacter aggregatus TaxID=360054 RepID=UPI00068FF49C|nr:ABC transporter permease [Bryobacter aggregatus]